MIILVDKSVSRINGVPSRASKSFVKVVPRKSVWGEFLRTEFTNFFTQKVFAGVPPFGRFLKKIP